MAGEEPGETEAIEEAEQRLAPSAAARQRATVEMIGRHSTSLRQTARRYSLCAEDAEDAYQRALEIALTKAPTVRPRELIRWTHTVTKHEALAVRRNRERLLGTNPDRSRWEDNAEDWVASIPASGEGPQEQLEKRERIARSREALQTLKPAELRALTLLAEGYSYVEIGEITGFSQTKVNRCLAEGRERFRRLVSRSEDGSHCREMGVLLSRFCDGEASEAEATRVREHLRACAGCRATMRAYRAAPGAAALLPALPAPRSLLEKAQDLLTSVQLRLPGADASASEATTTQLAASGGAGGLGVAGMAKLVALCAGTAGGAAVCVAGGVAPIGPDPVHEKKAAKIERVALAAPEPKPEGAPQHFPSEPRPAPSPEPAAAPPAEPAEEAAVEYSEPAPAPTPAPTVAESPESADVGAGAAGEFGP